MQWNISNTLGIYLNTNRNILNSYMSNTHTIGKDDTFRTAFQHDKTQE